MVESPVTHAALQDHIVSFAERAILQLEACMAMVRGLAGTEFDRGHPAVEEVRRRAQPVLWQLFDEQKAFYRAPRQADFGAEPRQVQLAARVPGHDMNNLWAKILGPTDLLHSADMRTIFLETGELLRAVCSGMGSLACPESPFPQQSGADVSRQLMLLVSNMPSKKLAVEADACASVRPDVALAVMQLVKNAKVHANKLHAHMVNAGGMFQATVTDNGDGIREDDRPISPEQLPHIFGTFSTKKGGGLGLQIVSHVMEQQHGAVEVHTRYPEGMALHYHMGRDRVECTGKDGLPAGTTFMLKVPMVA